MMTKADFQAVASAVNEAKRQVDYYSGGSANATAALERVTRELATACASRHKGGYGFKRQAFVEACGFPES